MTNYEVISVSMCATLVKHKSLEMPCFLRVGTIKAIIQTEYQKNIKTLGNPVFSRVFLCFGFIKNLYEKGSIYMRETQVTHMCNTRKTVSCARFLMSCARYFLHEKRCHQTPFSLQYSIIPALTSFFVLQWIW